MKLNNCQEIAVQKALASLDEDPKKVILLQGMSGFGKTTIASEIARRRNQKLFQIHPHISPRDLNPAQLTPGHLGFFDHETGYHRFYGVKIASLMRRIRQSVGILFLENIGRQKDYDEGKTSSEHEEILSQNGIDFEVIHLGVMTDEEVEEYTRNNRPAVTPAEMKIILDSSLGIPLLVRNLVEHRVEITSAIGRFLLSQYILYYFSYRRDTHSISATIEKNTGRHLEAEFMTEIFNKRFSPYGGNLEAWFLGTPLHELEHSLPLCPETLQLYEKLSQNGGDLRIFIPFLSDQDFISGLGFSPGSRNGFDRRGRLHKSGVWGRKTFGMKENFEISG